MLLYCAILKNVLCCNYISGKSNFKKNIFLAYHSTSFCPQSLLMTSKLRLRELNIEIHLWDDNFFDNFYGFGSVAAVFKIWKNGETFRKTKFRQTWTVFPPYISCIGRKIPFRVMIKVTVMLLLSLNPRTGKDVEPFFVIFALSIETYFEFIWSKLSTNDCGIWNSSTLFTILFRNVNSASCLAPSGIKALPVVAVLHANHTQMNKCLT